MIGRKIREFLKLESASGIILFFVAILAMLLSNSPLDSYYNGFLAIPFEIKFGNFELAKPLVLWINDGLMAIFFLLVGLEIKREVVEGELSQFSQIALPGIAAVGGMALPACVYTYINWENSIALGGWAIPAATDIAFALGVLSLFGSRVPIALKIFLLTIAIVDDLGAIVIIALFYSSKLSLTALSSAIIATIALFLLNVTKVKKIAPYILVGTVLWVCVLKSGIHATLAGVVIAFSIPMRVKADNEDSEEETFSPLMRLEHDLHASVAFGILPLFAFANAGVSLEGVSLTTLFTGVPLGIALGLLVGKQIGVFLFTWFAVKLKLAKLPEGTDWLWIYGVSLLCGIGFTMSLFIGSLAFEGAPAEYNQANRLGVMVGSLLSGAIGYIVLSIAAKRPTAT